MKPKKFKESFLMKCAFILIIFVMSLSGCSSKNDNSLANGDSVPSANPDINKDESIAKIKKENINIILFNE